MRAHGRGYELTGGVVTACYCTMQRDTQVHATCVASGTDQLVATGTLVNLHRCHDDYLMQILPPQELHPAPADSACSDVEHAECSDSTADSHGIVDLQQQEAVLQRQR